MSTPKITAKLCLFALIGIIYFPIYLCAWLLRIVARFLLSIAYFGTLDGAMGKEVFKSLFSIEYERTF